ncbi:NAD(P)-dependent oxidoreductase [Thermogymnomonas acidicola]|nr:NAD(P)-dependent oxidoreductase [Thermogymnomonas acidicola]
MSWRVLVSDEVDQVLLSTLEDSGMHVDYRPDIERQDLVSSVGGYNVLVVRSRTRVDREVIDAGRALKVIARAGIGLDTIDTEYARSKGIKVVFAPGSSTRSVTELTFAAFLSISRSFCTLSTMAREGKFLKKTGREVSGKTLGIIGFGRIGQDIASVASAFGMEVLAYDVVRNEEAAERLGVSLVALEDLLRGSDYISINVTVSPGQPPLIGKKEFSAMGRRPVISNTSRAAAVDGNALLEALKSGVVSVYYTDVMWNEPPREKFEMDLLRMENFVVTPHIGAQTEEAKRRVAMETASNIVKAWRGEI